MALDRTLTEGDGDLRPSRWPPRLGSVPALRWALATVLVLVAIGLLYLREPTCTDTTAGRAATGAGSPGAGPSRSTAGPDPRDQTTGAGTPGGTTPGAGDPGTPTGGTAGRPLPVPAGTVGVPIRLAEPAALAVARPGIRVDLLAVADESPATKPILVAGRALVLDVLTQEGSASALYLALKPDEARRALVLPGATRFAIIVQP
ncbi:flagellar biosynthesis protein FlgA [Micromonospora sp. HM5-17]|uniref:flagellar biosynthesis protein FlgA n=1 Tax=Micromonospora sp. HM5-17 TaxID=2487710 RepID=UPI000F465D2C|nr:flagellar biosynthesis protein FlgA [Micromonospora sp. HM5-17]ROT32029.1 flagellar biosynthesis protein FlgA [Micromonospora sp. HM5-17]